MTTDTIVTIQQADCDGINFAKIDAKQGAVISALIFKQFGCEYDLLHYTKPNSNEFPMGLPLCFPFCGRTKANDQMGFYFYDNKKYPMPIHGFVYQYPWSLDEQTSSSATFSMSENDATLLQYPFKFTLRMKVFLQKGVLCYKVEFCNQDDKPMPYYAGVHPFFNKALDPELNISMRADKRLKYNDDLTQIVGTKPLLKMPIHVDAQEFNEQLHVCHEDNSVYLHFERLPKLVMKMVDLHLVNAKGYVQSYVPPNKNFFCIEHWMAPPNSITHDYQGMQWLEPSASNAFVWMLGKPEDIAKITPAMLSSSD